MTDILTAICFLSRLIDCAVHVFERTFPGDNGIFLFDNAARHRKFPLNGLKCFKREKRVRTGLNSQSQLPQVASIPVS